MNLARAQEIVRGRSLGLCELCRRQGIHTHHRSNRGAGGVSRAGADAVNRPAALVRLCLSCHDWIGHNPTHAGVLGLLVPRYTDHAAAPVWLSVLYGSGWWLLDDDGNYGWHHGEAPQVDFLHPGRLSLV